MKSTFRPFIFSIIMVLCLSSQSSYAVFFKHDPDDPAENVPLREGEKPVIPLDTEDPGYNVWQVTNYIKFGSIPSPFP